VQHLINLSTSVLVRKARVVELSPKSIRALDGWIDEPRAIPSQSFKESSRVSTVLGAGPLVARIECTVATIGPEVRPVPQVNEAEHLRPDTHLAAWPVTLEQMQLLETFENPEGEIDIDAERIKNLALKLERQSFAQQQMVVLGAPARSRQVGVGISSGSIGLARRALSAIRPPFRMNLAPQIQGIYSL
jgi:hypothetical protein